MYYRYAAKKYTARKVIKVGDTVELFSGASVTPNVLNETNLRGYIVESRDRPIVGYRGIAVGDIVVDIVGVGKLQVYPDKIKLIEQASPSSLILSLSNYLNHGVKSRSIKTVTTINDRGVFIAYNGLIALIERRSIKLNKDHYKFKTLLPVFEKFSLKQHIPIIKLSMPNFNLSKSSEATPFWPCDKKLVKDLAAHNNKILARRIERQPNFPDTEWHSLAINYRS